MVSVDRFQAMTAFVTVADLESFAAAARRLRLSPSVVTRLVAALEEHLGARLLQRTTRSVTLTDAGARYLERARRIVADVGEAEANAQAERTVPTGRFVVAAPNVFGRLHGAVQFGFRLTRGFHLFLRGSWDYFPWNDIDRYGSDVDLGGPFVGIGFEVKT